jgi:hypothetical protein
MKGQKLTVSRVLLWVAVLLLSTMNVSAVIYFNGAGGNFGGGSENTLPQEKTIRDYVIEGAGYFLESYSGFLLFLNKVELKELQGLDYNEVQMILNSAIEKMENARDVYTLLKQEADVTPYNPDMIAELMNFDYDGFQEANHLVGPIFKQVESYLEKGNIREIFDAALSHMGKILDIADKIKGKIDGAEFPGLTDLWKLNEACSLSLLFGQYAARVFQEIN